MLSEIEYHEAIVAQTEIYGSADDVGPRDPKVVQGPSLNIVKQAVMAS